MANKQEREEISSHHCMERYQLENRLGEFFADVLQKGFTVRKAKGYDDVFLILNKGVIEHEGQTFEQTYLCGNIQKCGKEIRYQGKEIPNFTLEIENLSPFWEELQKVAKDYIITRIK